MRFLKKDVGMKAMDVADDEIQNSVRKWLKRAAGGEDLPIILMPFDPEGHEE
jgi:hypothetical protein